MKSKHYNLIILFSLFLAGGSSYLLHRLTPIITARENCNVDEKGRVIIEDKLGRKVLINLPVKRIVSVYSAMTEALIHIGAKDLIKGTVSSYSKQLNVKGVGSHIRPDIEAILSCNPDLVIVSATKKEVAENLEKILKPEGVPILALHPATVDQALQNLKLLEKITGLYQDSKVKDENKKILSKIRQRVAGIPKDKRVKVFFEVRALPLLTCGKGAYTYDVIKEAGGIPYSSGEGTVNPVDIEKIVDFNPDFYLQQKGVMNRTPVDLEHHPIMSKLACVKKKRTGIIDEKLISRPGPGCVEAVFKVHMMLYPDKIANQD